MSVVTPTPLYDPALDPAPFPDAAASAEIPARAGTRRPGIGVERGSLVALLAATAVLYLWDLGASGYANSFYSAAAQAGSQDWTAWFFGALDSDNAITVDKPPAALWVMGLSVRLFGLNAWSILVPEALMGVATTWLVYATVRRTLTRGTIAATLAPTPRLAHWAALAGAAISALTPAAVLMFRFNNPDALLVLLLTLATYATVRASEHGSRRWLVGAGVAVGFAFLTKMLQAFVILPALVVAYAIAAPVAWKRKLVDLLAAFAAVIASTAWYILIFQLTPASNRPYMGGSQTNSFLELAFGYNGLGRITGTEVGSVGGGVQRGPNSGTGGLLRLFTTVSGGMVSWLIPAALILAVVAFVTLFGRRRAASAALASGGSHRPANRLAAGGLAAFAGTLVITGVVFSLMEGIYHDYYTVALAPAIGGTVAIAGAVLWAHRDWLPAAIGLSAASIVTGVWSSALASQAGGVYTIVGYGAAAVGILAGLGMLFADRLPALIASGTILAALAAALAGPVAYSLNTAATPHTGSIVTAGPVSGGMGGQPGAGGFGGQAQGQAGRQRGNGTFVPGQAPAGAPGQAPGANGQGFPGQAGTGTTRGAGAAGGMGGLLNGAQVSTEMKALLLANADSYTWVAASVGSQNAASYQLATNRAVMAIGGFNGSDPSPTLDQFKALVAAGRIHYFLGGGSFGGQNGGSQSASEIASWVQSTYTAQTVGSTTVYDLTQAK